MTFSLSTLCGAGDEQLHFYKGNTNPVCGLVEKNHGRRIMFRNFKYAINYVFMEYIKKSYFTTDNIRPRRPAEGRRFGPSAAGFSSIQ
jgi:hypothetical protein